MDAGSESQFSAKQEGRFITRLFCEELADVCECLELECVACGIEKEHGRLLANFTFEADIGLDDEGDACAAKALGQGLPVLHGKHDAEVGDGDIVSVDRIVVGLAVGGRRLQMRDDLMAEEIEVDPLRGAAALRATQGGSVKSASGVEVVDREGNMKGGQAHCGLLASIIRCQEIRANRRQR